MREGLSKSQPVAAPSGAGASATPVREAAALERMREGARWFISSGVVMWAAGLFVHTALARGAIRASGLLAMAIGLGLVLFGARWLRVLARARRSLECAPRDVLLSRKLVLLSRTEPWDAEIRAWDAHEQPLARLAAWQWAMPLFMLADGVPARVYGQLSPRSTVVVSCGAGVLAGRVAHTFEP